MSTITTAGYVGVADRNEIFNTPNNVPTYVSAGSGNDYIFAFNQDDYLIGGGGKDIIRGFGANDVIIGDSSFADVFSSPFFPLTTAQADNILGGLGNDMIYAGGGTNYVNGEEADDTIASGLDADYLLGGAGNDFVFGFGGNDALYGGTSPLNEQQQYVSQFFGDSITVNFNGINDTLFNSTINALTGTTTTTDTGDDYLDGGDGDDLIVGQDGIDILFGGAGLDIMDGGDGVDSLDGGADRDIIGGAAGNDVIAAGSGNDYVDGGANDDYLYGQEGEDLIIGGTGFDVLSGGTDSDVFLFRGGDGPDIITDFVAGSQADAVALQNTGFTSFAQVQGNLSFYAPGNATVLQIGSDQIFFVGVQPNQFDASDFFFI